MIALRGIALRQGAFRLEAFDLTVPGGGYGVLMGPTGCGKTTVLEVICGLRRPAAGRVLLDARDVTRLPPARRGVGYVPQDGALFPTLRVHEQLALPLRVRRWTRAAVRARVAELAHWLEIDHLLRRRPRHLSGGERQRVALGRALAAHPTILVLDEPLSALDEPTRERLLPVLDVVRDDPELTALHVTHARAEATRLATHALELAPAPAAGTSGT